MRTYVGLVRDHSASMRSLSNGAANDFNLMIDGIKNSTSGQDVFASVVECGVEWSGTYRTVVTSERIDRIPSISRYHADGGSTPLFDSVGEVISLLEHAGRNDDEATTAYLVMVVTDGRDNSSKRYSAKTLARKIAELQATDKWTFVFRVPFGYKNSLVALGVPEGNLMEWEQTETALVASTAKSVNATQSYFSSRAMGATSSQRFYADVGNVSETTLKVGLSEVTGSYIAFPVTSIDDGSMIKPFVEKFGLPFQKGSSYYQLVKTEEVQDRKHFIIKDRVSGKIYEGDTSARRVLGFPAGKFKLSPGNTGHYDIFIQSTSTNRKLTANSTLLYKR